MENFNENQTQGEGMMLNKTGLAYLLETTKWTKFLAVVVFICTGFIAITALVIMAGGAFMQDALSSANPAFAMMSATMIGVMYLVMAGLYFFFGYLLWNFSAKTKQAIQSNDEALLTGGIGALKTYFKAIGILVIVMLVGMFFAMVMAGCAAAMMI